MKKLISEKFEKVAKSISKSLSKEFNGEKPTTIYHYTSTEGLIGILSTGKMWFTDILYMNDSSELTYAMELIYSVLEKTTKQYENEIFSEVLENVWNFSDDFLNIYVLCFTEDRDLLSQWRAYGASGNGYAIGFDAEISNHWFSLSKVQYIPENQKLIVKEVIDEVYNVFNEELNNLVDLQYKEFLIHQAAYTLDELLFNIALQFKHPSFAEEKEWRLVYFDEHNEIDERLNFRCSSGKLIPFINLSLTTNCDDEFCKLPINKIVYGPTVNSHLTKKALVQITEKYGYSKVSIEGSTIPLRI
jgi:hypothetical protein